MKKIFYTTHAKSQIKLRNISKKKVLETIKEPISVESSVFKRKVAQKIYNIKGKKTLMRVIFIEENDRIKIITAYITTKILKYLKGS